MIVVIGASSGGVQALQRLVAGLDPDSSAAWCMALHIDSHMSVMPHLLERRGSLPAGYAANGERLKAGRIYLAPPDLHFLVHDGRAFLSRGPRENWTRPAIDPLFRSAARAWGPRAIGVILTGYLNDGTAGLMEIKAQGGIAIVQDPRDADSPDMPASAQRHIAVNHCVSLADLAPLLTDLVRRGGTMPHGAAAAEG